ncbi:lipopolysaccharide O-acetyltransferase [Geobacteraceae bacterium]|nr:lipopolysaccharide O-acetyltransferase [Geobacteraceae bacterium]
MSRPLLAALADAIANALTLLIKCVRPVARPVLRVWRLASLRAAVRGHIPEDTQFDGVVIGLGGGVVTLGEQCRFGRGVQLDTTDAGRITLGRRVRVNAGTIIVSNSEVLIGEYTLIGEYVSIRDANHGTAAGSFMKTQKQTIAPIRIGRDVWIGRGSCILKGVTIGDGAVIAANSVVTRDIEPGSICAGVPAKQIGRRVSPAATHADGGAQVQTHAP